MKRVGLLFGGLIGSMLIVGTACGGGAAATPTPRTAPRATTPPGATPTVRPATTPPTAAATPATTAAPTTAPVSGAALDIGAPGAEAKFDKANLTAKAGSTVRLRFTNNSTAWPQHNWVLVKPGTKDAVANDGAAAAGSDYVKPGDDRVIASTKQVNQGQTEEIAFTAPAAGTYQYVCTFPAHNSLGMFGELVVTP